ncbi:MAG TPA: DUF302 domain-containing protein [Gammaproteobacteria bacterium]|nr:DUF302 domain-containing protein [Gammaproteobacteria bacterium]
MRRWLFIALLLSLPVHAADLFMVRSELSFPEAMAVLQEAIRAQGYQVSRVQRVDIGLTKSGYKTDKYRVVFFGKKDEIEHIADKHIDLIPYVPIKIAIFAEQDNTILLSSSFSHLRPYYRDDDELLAEFDRWEKDLQAILKAVQDAD